MRIDAALSFVNALNVKRLLQRHAEALHAEPRSLVLDASGINDIDATGAEMLAEVVSELEDRGVGLHLTDVKGPVRDVLRRAGIWDRLEDRVHTSTNDAVQAITASRAAPADKRRFGIDELASDQIDASSNSLNSTPTSNPIDESKELAQP